MSYELVQIENSLGVYTASRIFRQSFGLTPNDASVMNIAVKVVNIVGGTVTAAVTMDESYDNGATWQSITLTNAAITVAGIFLTSPNETRLISPLVRLTITPATNVVLTIESVKRTRIASGSVAPKQTISVSGGGGGGAGGATEVTLAAINSKVPALGQASAANSSPVVLTAAQIATLTPFAGGLTDAQLRAAAVSVSVAGEVGRTVLAQARNVYTVTPVTTAAYVQLVATVGATAVNMVEVFDSSGEQLVIAFGVAASEVDQCFVTPGGNGQIPLFVPAGTRVSIKAVSATASVGFISVTFYS